MNNKGIISIVILLVAILLLFAVSFNDNQDAVDNSGDTLSFNATAGTSELIKVINTIKTSKYYEGYDLETLDWMESLGNKKVLFANEGIVIMDSTEALKIPSGVDVTDADIYNYFTAEVIENHDLGSDNPTVYYVKNVIFKNQEIIGNGLA